jgi:hypothetical protein
MAYFQASSIARVFAALVALAVAAWSGQTAHAQSSPPAGSWHTLKKNTTGTWKRVGDKAVDHYHASPNLQLTVEEGQTLLSLVIDAGAGEAIPVVGDVAGAIMNSPEFVRTALDAWLANKIVDAIARNDKEREARMEAIRSCLKGDCAALNALLRPPPPQPGRHTGQPERAQIVSVTVLPSEIEEGQTARVSVTVRTMLGGDVTVDLQSPGERIGPTQRVFKDIGPGASVTGEFDQFFGKAGSFRLLALARDPHSDDAKDAMILVKAKQARPLNSKTGNSGTLTGDGLELIWNVSGADVGERFFADRTWQAKGVVTGASVRFWGVMRASVPARLTTDSDMSAYISGPMSAGKKQTQWKGTLGAPYASSHETTFDLSFEPAPGQAVLVSASVNKVGGAADLLGVMFQFDPKAKP